MTDLRRAVPILVLLLAAFAGCGPADPRENVLVERAKWNVDVLSWAMAEGGKITISARISGPVHSDLTQLTVLVEMLDAEDRAVGSSWKTLDLSGIQRGGPEDVFIRLEAPSGGVEGIRLDTLPDPAPDQIPSIPELNLPG